MSKKGGGTPTISTYYASIHFVLCHGPIDKVSAIYVDDKLAWSGTSTGGNITIAAEDLFGGKTREGGISGLVNFDQGLATQVPNAYLVSQLGTVPANRGVVSLVLNQVYLGLNYYFKPWNFIATRIHVTKNGGAQWQDTKAEVGTGLINGVHVIRECLTDYTWGLGVGSGLIHEASFLSAATTCYNEGLGFSFLWDKDSSILDFISEVLKHIQGSLYLERSDGLYHLELVRPIADLGTLVSLNTTNVKSVSDFKRRSVGDLVSQVSVKFIDNSTNKENTVNVSDPSLTIRQGSVPVIKSINYDGVTDTIVAQKLAIRDLQQFSLPTYSCSIVCNRDAENLHVGSAFKLTWPDYTDEVLVMRVIDMNLGSIDKQAITINAIQDTFQAASVNYDSPAISGWTNPVSVPTPVTVRLLNEVPYYLLARQQGDTYAQSVATTNSFIDIAGASPTSDAISAQIWSTTSTVFTQKGVLNFCFTGLLAADITKTSTTITIISPIDLELLALGSFIQIDNELLGVTAMVGLVLTVLRGVCDTVPEVHLTNARAYGWNDYSGTDDIIYLIGEVPKVKLLTTTGRGTLDIAAATQDTITISGRMHKPYPPGNVTVNTVQWPATLSLVDITVAWATRNRLQQTASLISFYTASITTEASVTYSGDLRRTDTNAVLLSFSGNTGITYVFPTLVALAGTISSITFSTTTATVTMSAAHGLVTGRLVKIAGATDSLYNGDKTITVTSTTQFTYSLVSVPVANASGTLTAKASLYAGTVKLTLWSVRGTFTSHQNVTHTFTLS